MRTSGGHTDQYCVSSAYSRNDVIAGTQKRIPRKELTDVAFALCTSNVVDEVIRFVVFEPENATPFMVGKVVAPHFFAILHYELQRELDGWTQKDVCIARFSVRLFNGCG